jgi:hypothetical protein
VLEKEVVEVFMMEEDGEIGELIKSMKRGKNNVTDKKEQLKYLENLLSESCQVLQKTFKEKEDAKR